MSKLIFIYNAKSGLINKSFDYMHKVVSPSSYSCDLCSITHTNFGSKKEWDAFISELKIPIEIKYRDQADALQAEFGFPSVLYNESSKLISLVDKQEFKNLSVVELIELIKKKLNQISSQE